MWMVSFEVCLLSERNMDENASIVVDRSSSSVGERFDVSVAYMNGGRRNAAKVRWFSTGDELKSIDRSSSRHRRKSFTSFDGWIAVWEDKWYDFRHLWEIVWPQRMSDWLTSTFETNVESMWTRETSSSSQSNSSRTVATVCRVSRDWYESIPFEKNRWRRTERRLPNRSWLSSFEKTVLLLVGLYSSSPR